MYKLFDSVTIKATQQSGVIVEVYQDGEAYEVEVFNDQHETEDVLCYKHSELDLTK